MTKIFILLSWSSWCTAFLLRPPIKPSNLALKSQRMIPFRGYKHRPMSGRRTQVWHTDRRTCSFIYINRVEVVYRFTGVYRFWWLPKGYFEFFWKMILIQFKKKRELKKQFQKHMDRYMVQNGEQLNLGSVQILQKCVRGRWGVHLKSRLLLT